MVSRVTLSKHFTGSIEVSAPRHNRKRVHEDRRPRLRRPFSAATQMDLGSRSGLIGRAGSVESVGFAVCGNGLVSAVSAGSKGPELSFDSWSAPKKLSAIAVFAV